MGIAQGTVKAFDESTGSGALFLDDGTELLFDRAAFAAGGLRRLRPGQRVRYEAEGGTITRVTLLTLP
jgi:2-phospho-L-lactate guanylyltransferase